MMSLSFSEVIDIPQDIENCDGFSRKPITKWCLKLWLVFLGFYGFLFFRAKFIWPCFQNCDGFSRKPIMDLLAKFNLATHHPEPSTFGDPSPWAKCIWRPITLRQNPSQDTPFQTSHHGGWWSLSWRTSSVQPGHTPIDNSSHAKAFGLHHPVVPVSAGFVELLKI